MRKELSILFLFLSFSFLKAQNLFQKTYGGSSDEFAFSVKQTGDGGFIFAGYSDSYGAGQNDIYIVKIDSTGNVAFSKSYGGLSDDEGYSVIQTTDGGYAIAGYTRSFGAGGYDAILIKTNANGDTLFTKTYGGTKNDFANVVVQTNDGGYILAGYTTSFVSGSDSGNAYLIKTDVSGNIKWSKSFGGTFQITDAYSIKQTSDNGYIITGYTNAFGELYGDAFLTKTDSLGTILFTKTYGGKGVDWGNSVLETNDGGYAIAGSFTADSTTGNDVDVYLIKTNANGDSLFTVTFGGSNYDYGQYIEQTSDSGFTIVGYSGKFNVASGYDFYFIKVTKNGDTVFTKSFGGIDDDEANSIYKTTNDNYLLVGSSNSFSNGNDYDFFAIKVNSNNISCNQQNIQTTIKHPKNIKANQTAQQYANNTQTNDTQVIVFNGVTESDVCNLNSIITLSEKTNQVKIFPNPSNENITISNVSDIDEIRVVDVLGQLVYQSNPTKKSISLQIEKSGIYFLIITSNYINEVRKIIIE